MPGLLRQGKEKYKKKMMAVYDADTRYAERLSDYVNRKSGEYSLHRRLPRKKSWRNMPRNMRSMSCFPGERTDSGDISEIPSGQKIYMSEETGTADGIRERNL